MSAFVRWSCGCEGIDGFPGQMQLVLNVCHVDKTEEDGLTCIWRDMQHKPAVALDPLAAEKIARALRRRIGEGNAFLTIQRLLRNPT